MGKKQQWLEMAELGFLLLVFFGWLGETFWGERYILTAVFLGITLGLGFCNRLIQQHRQRRQTLGLLRNLEQRLQEHVQGQIQPLLGQLRQASQINGSLAKIKTKDEMQAYLGSLEQSLTNVVQYLNQAALAERLSNLEQTFLQGQHSPAEQSAKMPQDPAGKFEAIADPWAMDLSIPSPQEKAPKQGWQLVKTLTAHRDCVSTLAFSEDQRFLASGSWDQQLKLWRVEDGKQISQVTAHGQGILNLQFIQPATLPEETVPKQLLAIATGSFSPEVKLWQLDPTETIPQWTLQRTLEGHQSAIYGLATTSQQTLITGSHDQTLRQWQLEDGSLRWETLDLNDQIQAIALAPQENLFITGGTEGSLKFWRTADHKLLGHLKNDPPEAIAAIAIRADGKLFASAGEQGLIQLWQLDLNDLATLPETVPCYTLHAHDKPITKLLFSGQGNFLLSSSVDGLIKIWQLGIPEPLVTLNFNTPETEHIRLLSMALSADGNTLAAGGSDGTIKLWQQT